MKIQVADEKFCDVDKNIYCPHIEIYNDIIIKSCSEIKVGSFNCKSEVTSLYCKMFSPQHPHKGVVVTSERLFRRADGHCERHSSCIENGPSGIWVEWK